MGQITRDQSHAIMAALATNTDWDSIDFDAAGLQDRVMRDMAVAGRQFTAFLKNGARVIVGEPKIVPINRSLPFDPAKFIGAGWTIWRGPVGGNGLKGVEDQDERSLALAQINLADIQLATCLKGAETVVKGEEKQLRLKADGRVRLDAKVFQTFWENQALIPERFKERVNGNIQFIYFDGTVLQDSFGRRFVLFLFWGGGAWRWLVVWLGRDWDARSPSAVLAS